MCKISGPCILRKMVVMKMIAIFLLIAGPFCVRGQSGARLGEQPSPYSKVIRMSVPMRPWYDKAKADSVAADSLRLERTLIAALTSFRDSVMVMRPDGMPCIVPRYVQRMYR